MTSDELFYGPTAPSIECLGISWASVSLLVKRLRLVMTRLKEVRIVIRGDGGFCHGQNAALV